MSSLLEEIMLHHFPYPPATREEIEAFEQRVGWQLDPDLRAFYLHCNGAELLKRLPECPYQVLPLSEIIRAPGSYPPRGRRQMGSSFHVRAL